MEDARKLLDSMMGNTRNQSLEEAKKNKGSNFQGADVCKHYLLGFCPQYELGHGKITRRNLGECNKAHSDAMRAEYEDHPEKEKYRIEFEKALIPVLESCVREADSWVARERANASKAEQIAKDKHEKPGGSVPHDVKEQLKQLNEDVDKMMAAAEKLAEQGDIESSKFKVILAEEIKAKVKEIEQQHADVKVSLREEWVCDVCGTRTEAKTEENNTRYQAHFTGQVHLGYQKIREWVKMLKDKQDGGGGGSRSRGARDREGGESKKERSRSRGDKGDKGEDRRSRRDNTNADGERDGSRRDERPRDDRDSRRDGSNREGGREDRDSYRGGDRDRRGGDRDRHGGGDRDRRSPRRDDRRGDRDSDRRRDDRDDQWKSQSWGDNGWQSRR